MSKQLYVYALRHKETGLYFCPTRPLPMHVRLRGSTNLRKGINLYTTKPNLSWYRGYTDEIGDRRLTGAEDFVIEIYNVVKAV